MECFAYCSFNNQMIVAILGADGAGKSTLITALKSELKPHFSNIMVYHWRPHILPDVGVMIGLRGKTLSGGIERHPHNKNAHGLCVSIMRLLYYWFDFLLGIQLLRFRYKKALVLFDRFYCDMWMDQKRFRLSAPTRFIQQLERFVTKPDLYILLVGDPLAIYARKPETSVEAIAAINRHLLALNQRDPDRCLLIQADSSPNSAGKICRRRLLAMRGL
jgi:thymidylate kinase